MSLNSDVLAAVQLTAQRVSGFPNEDARDLAWWVLRIAPALDRLAVAQHAVRRASEPQLLGCATDARDEAVYQLVHLLGRTIPLALTGASAET